MPSVYPAKITLHSIPEIVQKHNLLIDMLGKDLSFVVQGGGVGDVKSPVFPGAINDTVVLFDGTSGKRIKASTIYAEWFDQSVATTASPTFVNLSVTTVNALTPTALTVGFRISGGTTSKTLTVPLDATVSGTNTGDQDLSGYLSSASISDDAYGETWDGVTDVAPSKNAVFDAIDSLPSTHGAVTIGTPANGLSLDGQELSLALASTSATGALSDTDWNTFNGKQSALSKASGAELDTGTDDTKFATARALKDSHNVPSVVPGTSGNVLTSDGTDWTSAAPTGGTGTDVESVIDRIIYGGEGELGAQLDAILNGGAIPPLSHPTALVEDVLTLTNTVAFTPTTDYHPATKKYVDNLIGTPLVGTKVYYVADTSSGATTRKLTFVNGILTSET